MKKRGSPSFKWHAVLFASGVKTLKGFFKKNSWKGTGHGQFVTNRAFKTSVAALWFAATAEEKIHKVTRRGCLRIIIGAQLG